MIKIQPPPFFQTPNDLVDHWMPLLTDSEVRVLLIIFRKTFGWHKDRDRISLTQFQTLSGLTRSSVTIAIKKLVEKGVILKETIGPNGSQETYYELNISEDSNNSYQSSNQTPPQSSNRTGPVRNSDPQKTSLQNTSLKKQQQAASPQPSAVAVSSENQPTFCEKISPILKDVEIPETEKIWISKRYSDEIIKNAIDFVSHPSTVIKTSLVQLIKWACEKQPSLPKSKEDIQKEKQQQQDQVDDFARRRAQQAQQIRKELVDCLISKNDPYAAARCEARPDFFRIENDHEQIKIRYDDNNFKDKILEFLKRIGYPVPKLIFSLP